MSNTTETIYTRDIAAHIIETHENILIHNGIRVPSPEDDEREPEDLGFYGSTYSELLDTLEATLCDILEKKANGARVVACEFSGLF